MGNLELPDNAKQNPLLDKGLGVDLQDLTEGVRSDADGTRTRKPPDRQSGTLTN